MQITPNLYLIAIQAIPFLFTAVALNFIIFRPMLAYLDERREAMTRGRREAEELDAQVRERMARYESRLAEARREIAALRKQRRSEALAEAEALVAAARERAEARVEEAVAEIARAEAEARAELRAGAERLALQVAGQVLGRPLSPPSRPTAS